MKRKHADYIYRNKRDTLRVRVHRRENGRWDYDVFYPSGAIKTYSDDAGDNFATKRAAVAEANEQYGPLFPIAVEGNVTDPAWYQRATQPRTRRPKKTSAQLDREIADALARPSQAHAKKRGDHEGPSGWMSKAAGIITDEVRASEAYRRGREEVLRAAVEAIGPAPSVQRLRDLGGLTQIVNDTIKDATTPGLDDNLGSAMFPHTARAQLRREIASLRTEVQHRLARAAHATKKSDDDGIFYLTDVHERPLGPEFSSRAAAKRAATKLVREGEHPRVEVWHRWRGDRYMQGLASEEGWSDV